MRSDREPETGDADDRAPDGFAPTRQGQFSRHIGPYYEKRDGEGFVRGFRVQEKHLNAAGVVHGGMLTAFMDSLLGHTVFWASGHSGRTVRLVADFVGPAKRGDWVEGRAKLIRATRTVAFVEGTLNVGGRQVMRADGVFRLSRRKSR
ncbi:MAG TPA: PaaI family thioesterase [Candidatus Cybelea sp.]|nr:PaaI family thioesterase [Candidatus Cybelea sp.]